FVCRNISTLAHCSALRMPLSKNQDRPLRRTQIVRSLSLNLYVGQSERPPVARQYPMNTPTIAKTLSASRITGKPYLIRLGKGCRPPCKSLSREKKILLTRASEERARRTLAEPAARTCASRRWFLPSQNRTSIHCLRPLRTVTED